MDNLDQIQLVADKLIVHSSLHKIKIRKFKIANPTPMEIAFKLCNTSLPDFILIEPDHGYIKSHDEVNITITILPFNQEFDYEPVEEITTLFCKAPPNKNLNVFTKDYPWPEESRASQMVIKFVKAENDENSTQSKSGSENSSNDGDIDINEFEDSNEVEEGRSDECDEI